MKCTLKNDDVVDIITMLEDQEGCIYRHFKGNLYRVLYIGKHTETLEDYVIYQQLADEQNIWIRPVEMFVSKVDKAKYSDVKQTYRFEKVKGGRK